MKRICICILVLSIVTGNHLAYGQNDRPKLDYGQDSLYKTDFREIKKEAAPKAPVVVDDAYEVGVDDVLEISVIKPQQFDSLVTVAPDGAINFPYIGNVDVKGLTLPKIQEQVQKRLADGYMEYPVVSVSLRESRSRTFTIYGQVTRPGTFPIEGSMTILRALTVAGGLIAPGSTGKVKLLRPKSGSEEFEIIKADLTAILSGTEDDRSVHPGDRIIVSMDKFYISGQVARPGSYPVEEDMSLLHAITVAGGFIDANATGTVKLLREKPEGGTLEVMASEITAILNGKEQNTKIQAGDTIVVAENKFYVHGEVTRPGMYSLESGTTALKAVSTAGGFMESGATGKITLMRPKSDGTGLQIIKSDITLDQGGGNADVNVRPGDTLIVAADKFFISGQVTRPGAYTVKDRMTILQAITAAGGLIESGATGKVKLMRPKQGEEEFKVIESDITEILSGAHQDVILHPGDTVLVSADKFYVYGEVTRPGMYPLESNMSALTAISLAGGFTKFGSASRVKVLRMDGESSIYETIEVNLKQALSGNADSDARLEPGDIVVVSEGMF